MLAFLLSKFVIQSFKIVYKKVILLRWRSRCTYLEKLASVCIVLAIRVRFLAALSVGNSWHKLNKLGDKMAGHRNRRKMDALMRFSLRSAFCSSSQRPRKQENTLCSSLGKKEEDVMIFVQAISQYIRKLDWWVAIMVGMATRVGSTSQSSPPSMIVRTKSPSVSFKYWNRTNTFYFTIYISFNYQ